MSATVMAPDPGRRLAETGYAGLADLI